MGTLSNDPVYVAADLLSVLCELAADRDPDPLSVPLGITPTTELETESPMEGAVFTHFYLPETARSVRAVFGVDLGTPSGATPGIFITHPDGRQEVTKRDELREVVFVAVPPWEPAEVVAYNRRGRPQPLRSVEVSIPEESLP